MMCVAACMNSEKKVFSMVWFYVIYELGVSCIHGYVYETWSIVVVLTDYYIYNSHIYIYLLNCKKNENKILEFICMTKVWLLKNFS